MARSDVQEAPSADKSLLNHEEVPSEGFKVGDDSVPRKEGRPTALKISAATGGEEKFKLGLKEKHRQGLVKRRRLNG